jgi:hypothetical protein
LLKNRYSSGLEDLHFGKNKLVVKDTVLSTQIIHNSSMKDIMYLMIGYTILNEDKVIVDMDIPEEHLTFNLMKKNNVWIIDTITATVE